MDDIITYGVGMVMLFYGPPGTGKTMMANALANKLNKKVHVVCIHYKNSGVCIADSGTVFGVYFVFKNV